MNQESVFQRMLPVCLLCWLFAGNAAWADAKKEPSDCVRHYDLLKWEGTRPLEKPTGVSQYRALTPADLGLVKPTGEVLVLCRDACDAGDGPSCTKWGLMVNLGRGTERDETKAGHLFRKACDKGDAEGCVELAIKGSCGLLHTKWGKPNQQEK